VPSHSSARAGALHWHDNAVLAEPRWLVKKLLPETGVALMSGQWSTGKTFMVLHLAKCVWTEEPFAGHKIKRRGGTLLFAAEAAGDIPIRLRAITASRPGDKLSFAWVEVVPTLSEPGARNQLIAKAQEAAAEMQNRFAIPLALIVVDTMSAAAGFDDENSAGQVQPVMDVLHELARASGALVIAVDHYGKTITAGTRGSNAKESSADAVLALAAPEKGSNQHILTVRKLRSGPTGGQFGYSLKPVSFGRDQDGDEITTCVVEFSPDPVRAPAANAWKGLKDLKQALDVAFVSAPGKIKYDDNGRLVDVVPLEAVRNEFYSCYPVPQGDHAKKQEARRKAFNRQLKRGRDAGLICTRDILGEDHIWIAKA
jgi:AAA domain